jgi:hypothetical protein
VSLKIPKKHTMLHGYKSGHGGLFIIEKVFCYNIPEAISKIEKWFEVKDDAVS